MNKRVLLDLGNGETRLSTYEEFKKFVSTRPNLERRRLILKHFPEDVAREKQQDSEKLKANRWVLYLSPILQDPRLSPFFLTQQDLVTRARAISPRSVTRRQYHRVTDFTSWFYQLKNLGENESAFRHGHIGERAVQQHKQLIPIQSQASGWHLLHKDSLECAPDSKQISLLEINSQPLRGSPDYVFENPLTNTILIIEIKVTDRELHIDGWPNLRAQLWAYSLIDEYINRSANIILIGEVWSRISNAGNGSQIRLRQILKWKAADSELCKNNLELFNIYQNHINQQRDA